jgi:preprotein translocase subunit SecG
VCVCICCVVCVCVCVVLCVCVCCVCVQADEGGGMGGDVGGVTYINAFSNSLPRHATVRNKSVI